MMMTTTNNFLFVLLDTFVLSKMWITIGMEHALFSISTTFFILFYSIMTYCTVHFGHFTTREVYDEENDQLKLQTATTLHSPQRKF